MKKVVTILLVIALALTTWGCTEKDDTLNSQESGLGYPKKTLRIVVPYPGGGAADIKCRIIAKYLKEEINTNVIVENVVGAGGVVAMTNYLTESPNTDTIIYTNSSLISFTPKSQKVAYSREDFQPIISSDSILFGLYTAPKHTGITTFEELIEFSENNKVLFGSPGKGKPVYETQKQFFDALGSQNDTITHENDAKGVLNLLGGSIHVLGASTTNTKDYIKSGDLQPLVMMSERNVTDPLGNEITSIYNYGYNLSNDMLGLFAIRSGTDPEIVDFLYTSIQAVFTNEAYRTEITAIQDMNWDIRDPKGIDAFLNEYESNIGSITQIK